MIENVLRGPKSSSANLHPRVSIFKQLIACNTKLDDQMIWEESIRKRVLVLGSMINRMPIAGAEPGSTGAIIASLSLEVGKIGACVINDFFASGWMIGCFFSWVSLCCCSTPLPNVS